MSWQIRACLLVLICYQGTWLGMLELHQPEAYLWIEDEIALLEAIVTQVGVASQTQASIINYELHRLLYSLPPAQLLS
ncbi:MAG: GAF domain-containing protein [Nostoc sp. S4]|nr:GAF domain-containing protein [Nostoc sp. S4]